MSDTPYMNGSTITWIARISATAVAALVLFLLQQIYSEQRDIRTSIESLRVHIQSTYVTRDELEWRLNRSK